MRFLASAVAVMLVLSMSVLSTTVHADFTDNFDSYTLGNANGQGPWIDFGGALTTDVSSAQALSGAQSLGFSTTATGGYGSDSYLVNLDNGVQATSGIWDLSVQVYVPSTFDGMLYMFQDQAANPAGAGGFVEGAFLRVNNSAGAGYVEMYNNFVPGNNSGSLVTDGWAKLSMTIDLDNDTLSVSYNGTEFHSGVWDEDATGTPAIGGLNYWAQDGATGGTVYIDDLSLVQIPEPSSVTFTAVALLGLLGRRRRR